MQRIPTVHGSVMCDSVTLETLAVIVNGVSNILIVSVFGFNNSILYRTLPLCVEFLLHVNLLCATLSCWRLLLL
jgi:hypothetical protein